MSGAQSARGLFRATGKASRPVAVLDADGEIVKAAALDREDADFYPSPPEPTRAFLMAEGDRLVDIGGDVWEPAAGDGAMAREIGQYGLPVVCSDLIDRGCESVTIRDFFDFTEPMGRSIVTNPPYHAVNFRDGKGRWITHALDTLGVRYMALLLSWSWPGAGGLAPIWAAHPPARVYLMRWKIDFTGQGAPPMLNGWFVWDADHEGETALRMLDRWQDGRQGAML